MQITKVALPLLLVASAAWAAVGAGDGVSKPAAAARRGEALSAQSVPWPVQGTAPASSGQRRSAMQPSPFHADPRVAHNSGQSPAAQCPASGSALSPHAIAHGAPYGDLQGDPHKHARFVPQHPVDPTAPVPASVASNGRTVAGLHRDAAALVGRLARVRGTVVKLTEGIRGKTFAHLRDGSGSLEGRDNDLTVTTTQGLQLGQTLELEGTVQVNQDLGLGYRYPVLLQNAQSVGASPNATPGG